MLLFTLISLIAALVGSALALILGQKAKHARALLSEREELQKQRLYQLTVLKEIQERIGYELDIEKVADVITGSIKNLFTYSTVSSLLLKEDKLVFKTLVEENVSHGFINQVKESMMASLSAISGKTLPQAVEDVLSGVLLDDTNPSGLSSFFHIPLVVNNQFLGVITIASTKTGLYKESEMTILYQISSQASNELSRLHQVLDTEKGKLMAMIGSLSDGVFMVDTQRHLQVINNSARLMLKITEENPATFEVLGPLQQHFDIGTALAQAINGHGTSQPKDIQLNETTIQISVKPVLNGEGNAVIGASVLLHDVTLEKNLEAMKDDFTNMIVHELRAPLTAIRGSSQLIASSNPPLEKDQQEKLLTIMHDQSTKLLGLVNSLLDAAKLEAGKFTLSKETGDLKRTVQDTITVFIPQAQAKHVTLLLQAPDHLPSFSFDSFRITQVMNNLLSNALKFTPQNGKITIKILPSASEIIIAVSDTGIGIPKEQQDKLFSKFYQIKHDKTDLSYITAGTGLGLYIVKGIVEAHGGSVSVESEVGKGTTISFSLPVNQTREETQKPIQPATPPLQIFHTVVN